MRLEDTVMPPVSFVNEIAGGSTARWASFVALATAMDLSIHVMSMTHQLNMYMWMPRHPKPR